MRTRANNRRPLNEGAPDDIHPTSETTDQMLTELAAMRSVSEALEHLRDDETRARVLKWASEFFRLKIAESLSVAQTSSPGPEPVKAKQDLVSESELESFFGTEERTPPKTTPTRSQDKNQPVSMIRGFIADVQQLARDWHRAGPAPVPVISPLGASPPLGRLQ